MTPYKRYHQHHCSILLLVLLFLSSCLDGSHCFTATTRTTILPSATRTKSQSRLAVQLSDDNDEEGGDSRRPRDVLKSTVAAFSLALSVLGTTFPSVAAHAYLNDDTTTTTNNNKIVLQTTSYPTRFEGTSTSPIATLPSSLSVLDADAAGTASSSLCIDPDLRREQIFERTAPSVVFIDTFTERKDAFSTNVMEVPLGTGSGIVYDDKGHVVTNYHVIRSAKSANVAILTRAINDDNNGNDATPLKKKSKSTTATATSAVRGNPPANYRRSVYKARVVGVDPTKDVAVLKVEAPVYDLFPIDIGTSSQVRVGQSALAIGNPFGLDHSITAGIISGLGREVRSPTGQPISNVIQTDASINPGNSGGPLLDGVTGKVIGLNTAIYSPSGASAGVGFANPIDTVRPIVETLIRDGMVVRPALGISYLQSSQAGALGVKRGVLVLDVPQGSPAEKAGMRGTRRAESGLLELGDVIVQVEDAEIDTEADLFAALEKYRPGDRVKVTVGRLVSSDIGTALQGSGLKTKNVVLTVQLKGLASVNAQSLQFQGQQGQQPRPYHGVQ